MTTTVNKKEVCGCIFFGDDIVPYNVSSFLEQYAHDGDSDILSSFARPYLKNKDNVNDCFIHFCDLGDIVSARWIADHFEITTTNIRFNYEDGHHRSKYDFALSIVCEKGYIYFAKWLVEYFRLTIEDIRWDCRSIIKTALFSKKMDLIIWMNDRFHFTLDDIAVICRCATDLNFVRLLFESISPSKDVASFGDNYLLKVACKRGDIIFIIWFIEHFGLTADDTPVYDHDGRKFNKMLCIANFHQHSHVVKWLIERFKFSAKCVDDSIGKEWAYNYAKCDQEIAPWS